MRARHRPLTVLGIACAAAVVLLIGAAPGGARSTSVSCGQVVTGDLTLANDLVGCLGDGLDVEGSNLTIDLKGHTITGTGTGIGILTTGSSITIENGQVNGFAAGVEVSDAAPSFDQGSITVTSMRVSGNAYGVIFVDVLFSAITSSSVYNNSLDGLLVSDERGVLARDNWIAGNGGDGLFADSEADGGVYQHNTIVGNSGYGIRVLDSVSKVIDNTVSNNAAGGIYLKERVPSLVSAWLVGGNRAYSNGALGISACLDNIDIFPYLPCRPGMTDGGGNLAWDNSDPRQCVNISCGTGPPALLGTFQLGPGVDFNPSGLAEAFSAKAGTSGSTTSLAIYVDGASTATQLVAGIYADNGSNHPGNLLVQGTLPGPPVAGAWNTVTLPPVAFASGTRYWIAILTPLGAGTIRFRDNCCGYDGSSSKPTETSKKTNLTTLPANWTKGTRYGNDGPLSAWAG